MIRIGTVMARMTAVTGSRMAAYTSTANGTIAREDQLGEVAGEIRLERVDALDRARGKIAGADVRRSPPGREHEQVLDEPPAQLGHDTRGTEPAGELEAGADERPAREHGGERDQRSLQRAQGDTVGRRARHDVAEQPACARIRPH